MLEERIVRYCAPTLAGIKTGGLFNTCGLDDVVAMEEAKTLAPVLAECGLGLRMFFKPGRHTLVYIYRISALRADLNDPDNAAFLAGFGYDVRSVEASLDRLAERVHECDSFPHEVGLFLSYPLSDVKSFIELGSKCCKMFGHWCVYSEEEKARWCFNRFDRCTSCYRSLYRRGHRIGDLAVAR